MVVRMQQHAITTRRQPQTMEVEDGDPCNDGNADTVNDAQKNCDCVGVDENANQCAINDNGMFAIRICRSTCR